LAKKSGEKNFKNDKKNFLIKNKNGKFGKNFWRTKLEIFILLILILGGGFFLGNKIVKKFLEIKKNEVRQQISAENNFSENEKIANYVIDRKK